MIGQSKYGEWEKGKCKGRGRGTFHISEWDFRNLSIQILNEKQDFAHTIHSFVKI